MVPFIQLYLSDSDLFFLLLYRASMADIGISCSLFSRIGFLHQVDKFGMVEPER